MKKEEKRLVDMLETALKSKFPHKHGENDDENVPWHLVQGQQDLYTEDELDAIHQQFAHEPPIEFPPDHVEGVNEDDETMPKRNLEISVKDDVLTITINLRKTQGISRTGRSEVISSTSGNMQLFDADGLRDEVLNMSVTRRLPKAKPMRWYAVR